MWRWTKKSGAAFIATAMLLPIKRRVLRTPPPLSFLERGVPQVELIFILKIDVNSHVEHIKIL